jgi:ABC-type transport system substrate-binding protein
MSFFFMEHPLVGGYTPDKVALRRAIGLAFDGAAYIRHVLRAASACRRRAPGAAHLGLRPGLQERDERLHPARAKALLDLHGYVDRNGDGWREQPDGRPLVLRMASMSTSSTAAPTRSGSAAWTPWA